MADFSVLVSSVRQTSLSAQSASVALNSELTRLRREADEVLSGQWRGLAARAFDRAWCSWDAGAREVVAALERLAEVLAVTAGEYAVRDELSASVLQRLAL